MTNIRIIRGAALHFNTSNPEELPFLYSIRHSELRDEALVPKQTRVSELWADNGRKAQATRSAATLRGLTPATEGINDVIILSGSYES